MNKLKIAFFTEAGSKRGMGHLVRCYTLFQKLKKNNTRVRFFLDSDINFDYKFKNLEYFVWDNFILTEDYDVIIIDSYEAPLKIYEEATKKSKLAVYIDDFSRINYPKGLIINFLPESKKQLANQKNKDEHVYLLGLDYVLIREEFLSCKIKKDKQIFVMLGGADTANLSYEILDALEDINIKKVIVLNNKGMIEKIQLFKNVKVLYKPSDKELIENMAKSFISISTASMTLYELSFLKVSSIVIAVSQNQIIGAKQFISNKIANNYIDIENINWKEKLKKAVSILEDISLENKSIIDGKGTIRIIEKILELVEL
ncbi:hypothetical protein [Arcobacter sp. CECT 8989]|uniref:hypothetical protein n=1 Tax=Arcobacter sp. CECT 8989 TaxID=2044509 RepID=UPI00100AB41F|nr:hypothetical protein [Arcobacter sp. CECT 8989]